MSGPARTAAAVFFDLDGCLVDSERAIPRAYNEALTALGLPPQPVATLRRFIGPPLLEGFTTLLSELGGDPGRAMDGVTAYREVYGEIALADTQVVPGVETALDALDGVPLAVVTSKPAFFAEPILAALGLAHRFRGVYAPDLRATTEAKAVALGRALREVAPGVAPARTAMVGDRSHDVVAGRGCGAHTVGVTWGAGDRGELVGADADRVIDDPDELPGALRW